ncbi:MAG: hypothetical protein Q7J06_04960 [Bacteroidales bacterium]|nr:hypothetical protein [Bacteroidales bacterium]
MTSNNTKKQSKVKVAEKTDLYHDIKPEKKKKLERKEYEKLLLNLEIELVKLQEWIKTNKLKVIVVFEGRDAAGKGWSH